MPAERVVDGTAAGEEAVDSEHDADDREHQAHRNAEIEAHRVPFSPIQSAEDEIEADASRTSRPMAMLLGRAYQAM